MRFVLRVIGVIISLALTALGIMTNVTPQQAESNLSTWFQNLPPWMSSAWARTGFFSLAGFVLVIAVLPWIQRGVRRFGANYRLVWPVARVVDPSAPPEPSVEGDIKLKHTSLINEFVPARDAVVRVNDKLHGTSHERYLIQWMEQKEDKERLEIAVRILTEHVPLFGIRPYKSIPEQIDMTNFEIVHADWYVTFSESLTLRKMNTKQVLYSDLSFKETDLENFVREMLRT